MFGYGYCHDGYGMMGGSFFGWIIPLILLIVIVYALYKIFTNNNQQSHASNAEEILKEKFVNGEISEEEYLRRKEILKRK